MAEVRLFGAIVGYSCAVLGFTTTTAIPTGNYKFGGYTAGNSKSNGVSCGTTKTNNGWVVISNSGGTVRITTVGNPECFHIPYSTSNNSLAPGYLNSEASNNYVNSTFAVSAMNMDYETANSIRTLKYTDGSDNYVIFTGEYYFLSTVGSNGNTLKGIKDTLLPEGNGYKPGTVNVIWTRIN